MADPKLEVDQIGTLIEAIRDGVLPIEAQRTAGKTTYIVPSTGHRAASLLVIDNEAGRDQPLRKHGTIQVFDAPSFIKAVEKNRKTPAAPLSPTVYVDTDPRAPAILAVMNDHSPEDTGWCDFRVSLAFRRTPEWLKWTKLDGEFVTQATFAEFIEDNMSDIVQPEAVQMLAIVSHLEATRTTNFRSGIRLPSGSVQLLHDQVDQVKVGNELEVPAEFTIGLRPFIGMPSYEIPARFRYRIQEGKLNLGFRLQRLETMMQRIIDDLVAAITTGLPNDTILLGLPISGA